MRNCFTYLIGWKEQDIWYYGVRYGLHVKPSTLWTTYFTSSKHVQTARNLYGEPSVIQIRKCFGNDANKAKTWEEKVLRRLNILQNKKWLNLTKNDSFKGCIKSWNEGLTKETSPVLRLVSQKISEKRMGQIVSHETKEKLKKIHSTKSSRIKNIWRQFKDKEKFKSYENLESSIIGISLSCWNIPLIISRELKISENAISSILKLNGIDVSRSQKKTKAYLKYKDLFSSYEDYTNKILELHNKKNSIWVISEKLHIHPCGVETLLKENGLTPNKEKRKTGPLKGTKSLGMKKNTHIWITNGLEEKRLTRDQKIPKEWKRGRLIRF